MADAPGFRNKMAEILWTEINHAILRSPEVRITIENLRDLKMIEMIKEFNLVLDVEDLVAEILRENPDPGNAPVDEAARRRRKKYGAAGNPRPNREEPKVAPMKFFTKKDSEAPASADTMQRIDGKALSPNEIQFQEFMNDHFNESSWMKRVGIRFAD